ncbi:MAG: cation-translocating P-type ATPase, partial [Minisyncoccales bacterium]
LFSFFIFLTNLFSQREILKSFEIAVVLAVAAIPEALPLALTVILSLGMKRVFKKKGLFKELLAAETLGSVSVVCLDKTGTITEGKMRVVKFEASDKEMAFLTMLLNNEQKSSLEVALFDFARENLKEREKEVFKKGNEIFEEPFSSEKKYSASLWEMEGKKISFLTGAPEIILDFCESKEKEKELIKKRIDEWAEEGLRVVGFAIKEGDNLEKLKEKRDFQFVGLAGVLDPIRKEAKEMVRMMKRAGIKLKIVTGDYRKTAEKVVENLGFHLKPENVMEGNELEEVSKEDLKRRIENIFLFSRITPHQKRKIIEALQERGEIVAMTGDGVNDVLALKEADIGIAVGEASEVVKEAAKLVLLDSNFKTIISACQEGRLIFSNIKKTVNYVLSNSFLEIGILFFAGLLKFPPPLSVVQILFLHFICDGPPDLMFAFEKKERDLMKRRPVDIKKEPIFDRKSLFTIINTTLFLSFFSLLIFWKFGIKEGDLKLANTLVFSILASVDLIYAISFKNLRKPIFQMENLFSNKFLFFSIFFGFFFLFLAIYFQPLSKILNTLPLNFWHWFIVLVVGFLTLVVLELTKLIFSFFERRNNKNLENF